MPEHHKVSLLLVGNQHRGLGMPQKYRLLSFFTKIILDFITRSIIYFLKNK